ncbi:hypothetical protein [Parafilimonas sp.]|uniref:hypothetical protein n=1 Tax=Parafilimonas sp. TaxID=1969739 RepID=UPI0039E6196B
MQVNINILNELKEAGAATLIQANNKNYYSVPEGYFKAFPSGVLANIFINALPSSHPYTVPKAYFENLPDYILDKINISSWQLQGGKQKNSFTVPAKYFNGFADSVIKKIKAQESNKDDIVKELEEISPLLSTISKERVYSLPENYFERLEPLKQTKKRFNPSAKIISLGGKTRKWINYAAAACISAVLFGGGYFFISGKKEQTTQTSQTTVTADNVNFEQQLASISDSEIEAYLKENSNTSVFTNVGATDYQQEQSSDLQTIIKNMSDDEIQQYLNDGEAGRKEEGI